MLGIVGNSIIIFKGVRMSSKHVRTAVIVAFFCKKVFVALRVKKIRSVLVPRAVS